MSERVEEPRLSVLAIIGSPRKGGNTEIMVAEAVAGVRDVLDAEISQFHFKGKSIAPCLACSEYCKKHGACHIKDDFAEFLDLWLRADVVIYGAPVYHMGVPAQVRAAIDRLSNVLFSFLGRQLPRFCKVGAAVVQGSSRYGGQETTIQWLVQHMLLLNCIPVAGDTPDSYIGAPGFAPTVERGSIALDKVGLETARCTGRRVGEVAKAFCIGKAMLADRLPYEYKAPRSAQDLHRYKKELPPVAPGKGGDVLSEGASFFISHHGGHGGE